MSYARIDAEEGLDRVQSFGVEESEKPTSNARPIYGFDARRTHALISVAAATVMCLFGYEQGVFGGIIVGQEFQEYFHEPSPSLTGFVTSVYDLGCFAGALLTLVVGEWLGRKRMLIIFTIIMTAGILVQTGAHTMNHLLWGRFVAGIGNGGNTATAPVWHVETSHDHAKGKAVVKEMVVNVSGFVISNIITLAFSRITTEAQWRFPLGIQLIFSVIILVLVPILPESPRWLLARGREKEAKSVLTRLNEGNVEADFKTMREAVREEQAVQASWADMFRGGLPTRRLLLGMILQICQQMTGINVLCYYLPLVLHKSVKLPELASRLLSSGIAVLYMFSTAASVFFIERLGRRPLLMSMAAAQAIAFLGIAISTEIGHGRGALIPGIVATVFITFYFLAFGFGWVAIPWLYPSEVSSLSMRTKGAALATACDWLFNYAVVQTTPIGIHYLKWGLYLLYAILNAAFVPLIYYLIVETAGKSLEQIDKWFAANPGWLVHKAGDVSYTEKEAPKEGDHNGADPDREERERLVHQAQSDERSLETYNEFEYDDDMHSIGMSEDSEESYGLHKDGVDGR
ncbi:hypothetical protein ACLMJK_003892 [Lecanora helva]